MWTCLGVLIGAILIGGLLALIHPVIGLVVGVMVFFAALPYGLAMDFIQGLVKYHHDRTDARTIAQMEENRKLEFFKVFGASEIAKRKYK